MLDRHHDFCRPAGIEKRRRASWPHKSRCKGLVRGKGACCADIPSRAQTGKEAEAQFPGQAQHVVTVVQWSDAVGARLELTSASPIAMQTAAVETGACPCVESQDGRTRSKDPGPTRVCRPKPAKHPSAKMSLVGNSTGTTRQDRSACGPTILMKAW